MAKQINHFYEFGSVRVDATNLLLYKDGVQVPLQPKVIDTPLVLVKNAQAVVDKETILSEVWQEAIVEEGGLKRNISLLRKALGEEGRYIETLPKRGYRLTAKVKEDRQESPFYGVQDAPAELVVQRRATVSFVHEREDEEEIPASSSIEGEDVEKAEIAASGYIATIGRRSLSALAVLAIVATNFAASADQQYKPRLTRGLDLTTLLTLEFAQP